MAASVSPDVSPVSKVVAAVEGSNYGKSLRTMRWQVGMEIIYLDNPPKIIWTTFRTCTATCPFPPPIFGVNNGASAPAR